MKRFKTIAVTWTSNDMQTKDIVNQCCEVLINIGVNVILTKKLPIVNKKKVKQAKLSKALKKNLKKRKIFQEKHKNKKNDTK